VKYSFSIFQEVLSTSIDLSLNYSLQKHGDLFPKAPTTSGRSVLASASLFLYSYSVVVEAMLRMVWVLVASQRLWTTSRAKRRTNLIESGNNAILVVGSLVSGRIKAVFDGRSL
jgi:hypothetical protein